MTSDSTVRKLKLAFRAAPRRAKVLKAQIYLELFASRREGYGESSFEFDEGDEYDVCRPAVLR